MKIVIGFLRDFNEPQAPDFGESPAEANLLMMLPGEANPRGNAYLNRCREYAAARKLPLVSGPFIDDEGYIAMAWLGAGCERIQRACFPGPAFPMGEDVEVFSGAPGKMALCVGEDIFQPQYARTAALRGCVLMFCALNRELDRGLITAGPWSGVQANCLPLVLASPTGGRLILPCTMTGDHSGMGRTEFDTAELPAAYREFPVFHSLNRDFYRLHRQELEA